MTVLRDFECCGSCNSVVAGAKKGAVYETCYPISKPTALSQELQTKANPPNPPGDKDDLRFSSGGLRKETKNQFPSCSSIAEHPADNRKTQERYLPGRHSNAECRTQNAECGETPPRAESSLILPRSPFKSPRVAEAD